MERSKSGRESEQQDPETRIWFRVISVLSLMILCSLLFLVSCAFLSVLQWIFFPDFVQFFFGIFLFFRFFLVFGFERRKTRNRGLWLRNKGKKKWISLSPLFLSVLCLFSDGLSAPCSSLLSISFTLSLSLSKIFKQIKKTTVYFIHSSTTSAWDPRLPAFHVASWD